jgi:ubiquinone biosynthesis accessory factor UbiJ
MQSNPFSVFQTAFQARGMQLACAAINHLLRLEPTVQAHLKAHTGRAVLLRWDSMLLAPAGQQGLRIDNDLQMSLCNDASATADVTVSLQTGLLQAVASERLRFIRIEGDALLAQDLALIAKQLRWDAEHDLARVIGDVPAHWVASKAHKAAAVFEQAVAQFKTTATQAVIHYPGWVLGATDLQTHQVELTALKVRIDALVAGMHQALKP